MILWGRPAVSPLRIETARGDGGGLGFGFWVSHPIPFAAVLYLW